MTHKPTNSDPAEPAATPEIREGTGGSEQWCPPVQSVTFAELAARFGRWQNAGTVHPLTCGHDSRHAVLVLRENDGSPLLGCPDCTYTQNWIPSAVLNYEPPPRPEWTKPAPAPKWTSDPPTEPGRYWFCQWSCRAHGYIESIVHVLRAEDGELCTDGVALGDDDDLVWPMLDSAQYRNGLWWPVAIAQPPAPIRKESP